MKISLLVPDLSSNSLGRAYILAKVLEQRYQVAIIGPMWGQGIWPPCDTGEMTYFSVPARNYLQYLISAPKLLSDTDVVYAIKPLMSSYGLALLSRIRHNFPLVLDIDDWELGFVKWRLAHSRRSWLKLYSPDWVGWTILLEKLVKLADKITVASTFLVKRYGGVLVPHGRDTDFLDPEKYDAQELRRTMGFTDEKIILFLGTPRPHKGIEDLIRAAKMVGIDKLRILLVGANSHDPYVRTLIQQVDNFLRVEDMTPLSDRPRWLAIADLVVLPQHDSPATIGQVPAKLFDAMAMAKPIIATAVSDIPSILEGCGFVIPPHNVRVLTQQIEYVFNNPIDATNRGVLARQRCIMHYSHKAMEKSLQMVFANYEI